MKNIFAKLSGKKSSGTPRKHAAWLTSNGVVVVDRSQDFENSDDIAMHLGGAELTLDKEGHWSIENSNQLLQQANERILALSKEKKAITEEKNLLQIKVEILLDLVTEYKLDMEKLRASIEKAKQQ